MGTIFWEIIIVLILTLFNGFFACSEIALISVRKTRIASLVKKGNSRAKIVDQLQKQPERLFATVQIGVSVITIGTSVFAGSRLAENLAKAFSTANLGFVAHHALTIAFILIVAAVAFVSLIIGELVPKSLGLRYAETFALFAAYPIWWLSKVSYWVIRFLSFCSNLILKPFKDSTSFAEARLSEEEIRNLMAEGKKAGTIEAQEYKIIENVFEFSDITVGKIMLPRTQMTALNIDDGAGQIVKRAVDSGYSRVPIYQGSINNIVGVLYLKNLLKHFGLDAKSIDIKDFLLPPYFVPNTMKISEVLQRLQRKKLHMALVTDEHGEIEGLVTLEDVLEEIVGDISDETDEQSIAIVKNEDSTHTVAGELPILDFNKYFNVELPTDEGISTLSGFIMHKLGRFAKIGDTVKFLNLEFTVQETTKRTAKIIVVKSVS